MNKLTPISFCLMIFLWAFLPAHAQRSNKSSNEYELVYESGNSQNGYYYSVFEKVYVSSSTVSLYSYRIVEGNYINGKLTGFGKILNFSGGYEKVDFIKKESDSARATLEINLLPRYYTQSGKENEVVTLKNYSYTIGLYKENYFIKGISYNSEEGKRYEGIFDTKGKLDYGSFTMNYKDTLIKGFIAESETSPYLYPTYRTSLHYFMADSSFIMTPFYFGDRVKGLNNFPISTYDANRKPVVNMRFKNGVYNGEAYNGKPEGLGEWISDDGEFVEYGYFKNGEPHGIFCKNFHIFNLETGAYYYEDYPIKRPKKGITIGLFNQGKPGKTYMEFFSYRYEGEVNDKFIPDGYGKLTNGLMGITEEGNFTSQKLDGYGTRIYPDKRKETGTFSYGVLTNGVTQLSVRSLQQYNVVKVNGKKLMVMEKIWGSDGDAYVKLSDGSILTQGDRFELNSGDDSEFYTKCDKCNGDGFLVQTNTYKYWAGNDTRTVKKVERIGGQDYIKTYLEITPKYIEQTSTQKQTCASCAGKGRLLKRK